MIPPSRLLRPPRPCRWRTRLPFPFHITPPSSPPKRPAGVLEWWVFSVVFLPATISKANTSSLIQPVNPALQQVTLGTAEVSNAALHLIALVRVLQSTTVIHLEAVNSWIEEVGGRESDRGSDGRSPAGGTDDGAYEGNEG